MTRDGVRLAWRDFGGDGPAVLLLHGLAGHAEEWAQTASWLTARWRVVALDAAGTGAASGSPAMCREMPRSMTLRLWSSNSASSRASLSVSQWAA